MMKSVKVAGGKYHSFGGKKFFEFTTAITSGVTADGSVAVVGDFAITTNATGRSKWFVSDGTYWVVISDTVGTQADFVAALTGASTGTANGALETEGAVSTAGGNTYADSAVNTVFAKIENNIAELAAKQEAIRANLVASGVMKSS